MYSSSKVTQRFRDSRLRLALNNPKINPLIKLKPRRRFIARISRDVGICKLRDPRFLIRNRPTVVDAGFANAEMLAVPIGESVMKGTVSAGECGSWIGVVVHADNVDVIGSGPPAVQDIDCSHIGRLEYEDLGVGCDCIMNDLPCLDEFGLR